jgi:hypothetical protein
MYVQGVSTRKVKAITEELCGQEFSASSISVRSQAISGNGKHDYSGTGEKISDRKVEEIGVCGPRAVA